MDAVFSFLHHCAAAALPAPAAPVAGQQAGWAFASLSSLPSLDWLQTALGLVIITNLCLLAAERRRLSIRLIALQGVILGLLPLLAHTGEVDAHLICMTLIFLGIKGVVLPLLLRRTYKKLPPQLPSNPYMGNTACVLAGMGGLVFSLWFASNLGMTANPLFLLMFSPAITTVLAGILLIVTRKKALSQMFGYLVMENGIYLLGVPMIQEDAMWVELTILLDILVAAFVMGIAIRHINKAFESTDVDRFASLRD
ncbi:hydrogenase-4 component E [Desulfovibrio sp. OttesenSCG-928-A18]|nr:hydrogenase-4 component E [Desulfovibrio sp. OttesenSCG-928-A18]